LPIIRKDGRCEKCSKEINEILNLNFVSFYSREWRMPHLNKQLTKIWLRAFFDCEAWVFCKTHQNRHIGVDCINKEGLNQVIIVLNSLGIKTIYKLNKKRKMHRIFIYGKENLKIFQKEVGFLHPDKSKKLRETLGDFVIYKWDFPKEKNKCKDFVFSILKEKTRIKKPSYARIISKERSNLELMKVYLKKFYGIDSTFYTATNGLGTIYYELSINRKDEVKKLINLRIIPNLFKDN
jgi:hypothetical protein